MSLDLEQVTHWMTLISLVSLIALGSFGCLCNILIFTSRQLRGNSCAFYFLCTAMVELSILGFGGITRLATEHFGSGLINYNQAFCKIRGYLNTTMSTISMYFVLLATIDRCMATSTHARCRAFSQIKVARRAAFTTTIILMALNVHNLVFFGLYPLCVPQPGAYSLFYSIYLMIHTSILPDGSILIFTLLTLRHVRQTRFRIAQNSVVTTRPNRQRRRMEKHLVLVSESTSLERFDV